LPCSILAGIQVALAALEQQQQQHPHRHKQQQQQLGQQPYNRTGQNQQQACEADSTSNAAVQCISNSSSSGGSSSSSSGDGYVCVLDDDVALHPLSLCQLVDEMQADPQLFMATGAWEVLNHIFGLRFKYDTWRVAGCSACEFCRQTCSSQTTVA
jgi:hypothetical protein